MRNFEAYYNDTLVEKVSKKEISEVLKNHNVLIGAEFEFILDDFNASNEAYDDAQKAYDEFEEGVKLAQSQYDEHQEELYKMFQNGQKLETKVEEADFKVDDANESIREIEEALEDAEDMEDQASRRRTIKQLKKRLADAHEDLNQAELDYGLLKDERKEAQEEEEAKQDTYLDDIDWPSMGQDYIDYMNDYGIYDEPDVFLIIAEGQSMPMEPVDYRGGGSNTDELERFMDSNGMLNSAPFSNYEFGDYGDVSQKVGSNKWAIEPDESLSEGGVEVKSPPMTLPRFMKMLPDMLKWINQYGYTNSSTGMHVHLSIKGVKNLTRKINPLKMILFMEEGHIFHMFQDRLNNSYVNSVKDKLKGNTNITDKDIQKIFNKKKLLMRIASNHFDAINFQNISAGHIEYRYMGGNNYSKKLKQITTSIGNFAHNLALGTDETYKQKEYALKLNRIFNKMELYTKERYIDELESLIGTDSWNGLDSKDQILLNKLLKEWQKSNKALKSVYKLDNKTRVLLRNNKEYMRSITDDWKKEIKKKISLPGFTNLML